MSPSPGDRLGPYEILAPLGAGGMGEVYEARDTRLGRKVAIKTLKGPHLERLRREARVIASLNHPHVCTLHDVGEDYLVMEYVVGTPLGGPLPPMEVVRYALQICDALEAAHARGITHRDLKPANILLTASGIKLLDFGIATVLPAAEEDTRTSMTAAGMIVGTVAYMSPEQAEGKPLDHRTDLFSLGVVLYELLAGRRPFERETEVASLAATLRDVPPPLPAEIPLALRSVVERCLEKEPAKRYASAADVRAALRGVESAPGGGVVSIAVLPFANRSRREEEEYFGDGIAHELIHALSRIEGLRVAARSAAFRFKGESHDVKGIGLELNVSHVVEGAIRVSGERLRITVELVQAADASVLWSGRFDRQMKDIFDIQDEVCTAIVDSLKEKLSAGSYAPPRRPTRSMAAYDAYLKGNQLLQRLTPSDLRHGAALLEEAARLDEGFALPLVGLSTYHSALAIQGHARSREALPRAEALALQALRIDESLPEAHRAYGLARLFQWDWKGAEASYRRSIELRPTYAQGYADLVFAESLRNGGDEVVRRAARVLDLAPLEPMYGWFMAQSLCLAGHPQRAIAQAEATIAMDPAYMPIYWWLSVAQWQLGRRDEAVESISRTLSFGDSFGVGLHALYIAQVGRIEEARAVAEDLEARWKTGGVMGISLVAAWVGLGEIGRALDCLEKSCDEREASLILLSTPWFDGLRAEPRCREVLRKVGLRPPTTDSTAE